MTKVLSAQRWLEVFQERLERREKTDGVLSAVMAHKNGFENWLKFEMAAVVQQPPWGYLPWINRERGDVGLEYRADRRKGPKKLVDLWASPHKGAKSWHFAELKVAFNNTNAIKQFLSWRRDFEALRELDGRKTTQRVASLMSVMFAVGFTEDEVDVRVKKATGQLVGGNPRVWQGSIETRHATLHLVALLDE